mmetsp:Transcript_23672/g.47076  ORF Transcript_23672/g.47076 Transcript_23672/m.47076 type:complete len:128 (+) Transcript_23672:1076-1459(+)
MNGNWLNNNIKIRPRFTRMLLQLQPLRQERHSPDPNQSLFILKCLYLNLSNIARGLRMLVLRRIGPSTSLLRELQSSHKNHDLIQRDLAPRMNGRNRKKCTPSLQCMYTGPLDGFYYATRTGLMKRE